MTSLILTTAGFFLRSYYFSKLICFDKTIFPFSECLSDQ